MPTKKPLKKARSTREPRPDKSKFASMIEAATVDAYDESEQTAGWYTMFDEHLALPFETTILGAAVKVTKLELRGDNTIVATCTRGRERQAYQDGVQGHAGSEEDLHNLADDQG